MDKILLDNNSRNYSLIIEKHAESYKQIFENTESKIDYYANQYEKMFENYKSDKVYKETKLGQIRWK